MSDQLKYVNTALNIIQVFEAAARLNALAIAALAAGKAKVTPEEMQAAVAEDDAATAALRAAIERAEGR